MGINTFRASKQARELGNIGESLSRIKKNLDSDKDRLNEYWKSSEMRYVNAAIDHITRELIQISTKLNLLETDIIEVAGEIRREEEEVERLAQANATQKCFS